MPFPTTDFNPKPLPDFTEAAGVKQNPVSEPVRDLANLDDLIAEMNIPKQPMSNAGAATPGVALTGNVQGFSSYETERPQLSKEETTRAGKITARAIDTAFSFGFSLYAKEKEDISKYRADESEINYLNEACSDISETYNFKMSPIPTLIMVLLFIYGPKFFEAKENKFKNEMRERQVIQEKKHDELEETVLTLQKQIMEMQKNAA